MLWECPDYKDNRDIFMVELRDLLGEKVSNQWALLIDLLLF